MVEKRKYHQKYIYPIEFADLLFFSNMCQRSRYNAICKTEERNEHLIKAKLGATEVLQPAIEKGHCTMLLLSNLVQPQWISIDCQERLINHVVCLNNSNKSKFHDSFASLKAKVCQRSQIIFKEMCYKFQTLKLESKDHLEMCPEISM